MAAEDEVRQASDQVYAALNRMANGDAGPMMEVWSHTSDVSTMPPIGGREECGMAKFMDVHNGFVGVTAEQLREAHERDLEVEAAEGVHFEHAWLDPQAGKVFCLSSGPSKEAVLRVHEKAGHPTEEIYELPAEIG